MCAIYCIASLYYMIMTAQTLLLLLLRFCSKAAPGSEHPICRSPSATGTAQLGTKSTTVCYHVLLACFPVDSFICLFVCLLVVGWFVYFAFACPTVCVCVCSFFPPRVDAAVYMFLIKLSFGNYLYFSTQLVTYTHTHYCLPTLSKL